MTSFYFKYPFKDPVSKQSQSEVLGVRTSTGILEEVNSNHNNHASL